MKITKEDKKAIIMHLKKLDIQEAYASTDSKKRKWFRFGAYDALRRAVEMIEQLPENNKK